MQPVVTAVQPLSSCACLSHCRSVTAFQTRLSVRSPPSFTVGARSGPGFPLCSRDTRVFINSLGRVAGLIHVSLIIVSELSGRF